MHRTRMATADAAWLHMDRPGNLMQVTSLMWSDERIDPEAVRQLTRERLVDVFPRFRQRVVESWLGARWEDDPTFNLDHHVVPATLPAAGGRHELQDFVSARMGEPLDRTRPLWRTYVIDGYGEGSAVLSQMHHCIADGIALSRVLLSLTDDHLDAGIARELEAAPGRSGIPLLGVPGLVRDAIGVVQHPGRLAGLPAAVVDDGRAAVRLLTLPPDRPSPFRGRLTGERRAAWIDPLRLEDVRSVAHAYDATVNDVVLAAMSGALRAYLLRRGVPPRDLRAIVPFNVRPLGEPLPRELGNKFGLVFLDLPVGTMDPVLRVAEVRNRMARIKGSAEGKVSFAILAGVGLAPIRVEKAIVDLFSAKGSAVMTNVVGPRAQVSFAGHPVRGVIPWVPTSGAVGLGMSIFSYHGEITVGLASDTAVVDDPDRILEHLGRELDALRNLAARPRVA